MASNTTSISGIQVDTSPGVGALSDEWAVYTVEFEFDNRLMVCHTLNQPIYRSVESLISRILSANAKSIELRRALLNSKYITVSVEGRGLASESEVLTRKYELIKANRTYSPYGYNALAGVGGSLERGYAGILLRELITEVDRDAAYPRGDTRVARRRGRAPRPVYSYDKGTGLPMGEYASVRGAAGETGVCASNISMCCNGHLKSAGGRVWSYTCQPMCGVGQDKDGQRDFIIKKPELGWTQIR